MRRLLLVVLFAAGVLVAAAQSPPPPLDAQQLCTREFGDAFKPDLKFPPMLADLDGDGQEDLVLVATSKNPLAGQLDHGYRAIDPYDAYFGFGDPKVTMQFTATNALEARYLLVIHNWRAPKAKFVIINLPFDTLSLARVALKKKVLAAIHVQETGGLDADVFWDGKKYRWTPSPMGNE